MISLENWVSLIHILLFPLTIIKKPQTLGFCKFGQLGMTIPQNQSHAFSQKSLGMLLEKGKQQLCPPNSPKLVFILFIFLKDEPYKKKMLHIVLSFRANLLHGSLETCRANWFLLCLFDLLHRARISGLFSQMGQINRVSVFIWNGRGEGRRNAENRRGRRRGGKRMWARVNGRKREMKG